MDGLYLNVVMILRKAHKMNANKIKVYVSHPIRGAKGKDATKEDMEANNRLAIAFGEALQAQFPRIKFYVPAVHDEFVMAGYEEGILNENQILSIDCKIIDTCNAVIVYIPEQHVSNGMLIEVTHANMTGKPVLVVNDQTVISAVLRYLGGLKK